ncbi:hypothetical protein PO002_00580 [Cupriavidus necator]|uniref:hypothetical protein n=1 Tax=Cupriavidus necator TaxID=106590 RepID=UPI0039C08372
MAPCSNCNEPTASRARLRTCALPIAPSRAKARELTKHSWDTAEAPFSGGGLIDLDGDGEYELQIGGTCGAGPNCEGNIYKLDRKSGRLYHYFTGGYAELFMLGGYLVEAGRASCCAWEFHVYRPTSRHYPISYDDMA